MNTLEWILRAMAKGMQLFAPLAWPAVVMIIVLLFRKQISNLLGKVKGAKGYGLEILTVDIDETRALSTELAHSVRDLLPDAYSVTHPPAGTKIHFDLRPTSIADYYFFSHDMMLCYTALITGAEREIIVHTLKASIAHIENFAPTSVHRRELHTMLEHAEKTNEADWTEKRRRSDARKIWLISRSFGGILEQVKRQLSESKAKP